MSNKCVNGFGGPNANNLFMRVEDPVEKEKRMKREAEAKAKADYAAMMAKL
jgi:hypothetical protein